MSKIEQFLSRLWQNRSTGRARFVFVARRCEHNSRNSVCHSSTQEARCFFDKWCVQRDTTYVWYMYIYIWVWYVFLCDHDVASTEIFLDQLINGICLATTIFNCITTQQAIIGSQIDTIWQEKSRVRVRTLRWKWFLEWFLKITGYIDKRTRIFKWYKW